MTIHHLVKNAGGHLLFGNPENPCATRTGKHLIAHEISACPCDGKGTWPTTLAFGVSGFTGIYGGLNGDYSVKWSDYELAYVWYAADPPTCDSSGIVVPGNEQSVKVTGINLSCGTYLEDGILKPALIGEINVCITYTTPNGQHIAINGVAAINIPLSGTYPIYCGARPAPSGTGTVTIDASFGAFSEFCCLFTPTSAGPSPIDGSAPCQGPSTGTPGGSCAGTTGATYYADCCGEHHWVNPLYPAAANAVGMAVIS